MALDIRYIPINTFQEIFLDKDVGCFLAGGKVRFYRDVARITSKEVFILDGSPPNYTYASIGSELTLSGNGTFEYDGNDVTVYLFPYDDSGNIDLYYATVESSGAVPQLTREGFPNLAQEEIEEGEAKNYIENGQFLLHHNIIADEDASIEEGEISDDITVIAPGGWTFERTPSSTAKDFVLFERIGSFVEVPSKSPRYALRVKNEAPGVADTFKGIRKKFRDVNKFSSDTDQYTFAFQAKSNSGSNAIEVKLIKNYGTGGEPEEVTILQVINLTSTYQIYDIPFVFGSNDGKTIGDNDDDFIQLSVSLPVASAFDLTLDTAILLKGDKQVNEFPDTTDAQFLRESLAGLIPVPDYEGANLYLPLRLGLNGFEYDTSIIGNYILKSDENLDISQIWSNGSKYRVDAYSFDKIPYRRLYEKWSANSSYGLSIYGPGSNEMKYLAKDYTDQSFATSDTNTNINNDAWQSFTSGGDVELIEVEIILGTPAPPTEAVGNITIYEGEGTSGIRLANETGIALVTGSNIIKIGKHPLLTSSSKYTIRLRHSGAVYWRTNSTGGYAGGSYNGTAQDAEFKTIVRTTNNSIYRLSSISSGTVTAAADGAIPTGFTFTPVQPDPYIVDITAVAASGMTVGSFWKYHTPDARKYIIWYEIDGSGTKPTETAAVYRKVSILSTDGATTVNLKTSIAINSYSIATLDWRGYFIRAFDRQIGTDLGTAGRIVRGDGFAANALGTAQTDENKSHNHPPLSPGFAYAFDASPGTSAAPGGSDLSFGAMPNSGGSEARSKNRTANIAIYY